MNRDPSASAHPRPPDFAVHRRTHKIFRAPSMTYGPLPRSARGSSATVVVEKGSPSGLPFLFVTQVSRPARKGFMRTQKQLAASRDNGRKSHGAATPAGKARIVNANLQSGIFAETQVLVWEHQE